MFILVITCGMLVTQIPVFDDVFVARLFCRVYLAIYLLLVCYVVFASSVGVIIGLRRFAFGKT